MFFRPGLKASLLKPKNIKAEWLIGNDVIRAIAKKKTTTKKYQIIYLKVSAQIDTWWYISKPFPFHQ